MNRNNYRRFKLQSDVNDFMDFEHGMHLKYTTLRLGKIMHEDGD